MSPEQSESPIPDDDDNPELAALWSDAKKVSRIFLDARRIAKLKELAKRPCTCGAAEHNAIVDEV